MKKDLTVNNLIHDMVTSDHDDSVSYPAYEVDI